MHFGDIRFFKICLGNRGNVAIMASEENEEPVVVERDREHGTYVVVFDPLDGGSSNIEVNVSVGSIFSVLRAPAEVVESGRDVVEAHASACIEMAKPRGSAVT